MNVKRPDGEDLLGYPLPPFLKAPGPGFGKAESAQRAIMRKLGADEITLLDINSREIGYDPYNNVGRLTRIARGTDLPYHMTYPSR